MKYLLRRVFICTFALVLAPILIPGFAIAGGFWMFVWAGIVLALMVFVLKPVLNLISFPANIMTLGLFSIFNYALILYLLTVFISAITIEAFTYPRTDLAGVIIPSLAFNTFLAYIYSAFVLSFIDSLLTWIMD